jgi:hypothetical protein
MAENERQFDGTTFLVFAKSLFLLFLQARHKGDLQPLRAHFAPGLYKAWQDFKATRVERRLVTRPFDYEIQRAELINHYQAQDTEVAIIIFHGLALPIDARRSLPPYPLMERWTFTRPSKLAGQICPVCGTPWTLTAFGKCRFCNRDFSGTNDGWTVVNAENLNSDNDPFKQENAFLDYWDDALRKIQTTPGRIA